MTEKVAYLPEPQQNSRAGLLGQLGQLHDAMTHDQLTSNFSCGGAVTISPQSNYGHITSTKTPITCPPPVVFWKKGNESKHTTIGHFWTKTRNWENGLDELLRDCSPATFGCDGENIFDEKIRKAGVLDPASFSTNFNPYDFGIVDTVAQRLLPCIARAGNQPLVERWGVVAELYKLNVYSAPSGMFKPHVDAPRGRTHFGSLVVVLPTDYQGGQLRVAHKDQEQFYLDKHSLDQRTIKWVAFYGDCEHEVLPVTAGCRITLTYQLYVSEHIGGLIQSQLQIPDSKSGSMYWRIKNILASPMFMIEGGILGFHCAYQYPETFEGTYYYERYPRIFKGIDAVLFTIFRALGLCVHIKPTNDIITINGELVDAKIRLQDILSGYDNAMTKSKRFDHGYYVGDEIFDNVKWFNDRPAMHPAGAGYLGDAKPTKWIGNEAEVEWDYSFRALLVVVPALSSRILT